MHSNNMMAEPVVTAIEANQCIQTKAHTVRLFAGKSCMVRVFISMPTTNRNRFVRGTLQISQTACGQSHALKSTSSFIKLTDPIDLDIWRNRSLKHSLNFLVPPDTLKPGAAEFRLVRISSVGSNETFTWENDAPTLSLDIHDTTVLRMRLLGINLAPDHSTNRLANFNSRFANTVSYLARILPVSGVISTNTIVAKPTLLDTPEEPRTTGTEVEESASSHWKAQMNALHMQLLIMRYLDIDAGADHRAHYHSILFSPIEPFDGSASDVPADPDASVVSAGPSVGLSSDRSGHYTAHEVGHALGLLHPGYCNSQQVEDFEAHEQYPRGLIANTSEDTVGLDTGDTRTGTRPTIVDGLETHDFMTYCDDVWISKRNYDHIHQRLMQEWQLPQPHNGRFLLLVGQFDTDRKTGSFGGIHRLKMAVLSRQVATSQLAIRLTSKSQVCTTLYISEKNPLAIGGDFSSGVFSMVIDEPEPLDSVELLFNNKPIYVLNAIPNSQISDNLLNDASINITSIKNHLDGIVVKFSQTRIPNNSYFAVQVKTDQSADWLTIGVFVHSLETTLVDKRYTNQPNCRIRVILSDMNHTVIPLNEFLTSDYS